MKKTLLSILTFSALFLNQLINAQTNAALSLDGVNDVINTPLDFSNITYNNWTYECWVNSPASPNNNEHNGPMYGQNMAITWDHMNPAMTGGASIHTSTGYHVVSFGMLKPNTWYHLAASWDGTTLKAYKNGKLISSVIPTGTFVTDPGNLSFGKHPTLAEYWNGTIDEARVWTVARTCAEINQTMNTTLVGNEFGLKAYYNFNSGTPNGTNTVITSVSDQTSAANTATLSSFGLTGTTSNFVSGTTFNASGNCATTCNNLLSTAVVSGDTLHCVGGDVFRVAVAYNPVHQLYYSVDAGGTTPDETFDINGNQIGSSTSIDWRGLWWNENQQVIEGNTWNNFLKVDSLQSNGHLGGPSYSFAGNTTPPDVQAIGAYDPDQDLIYYYYSGYLYGEYHSTLSDITPLQLTGIPSFTNILSPTLFYYNCPGKEIALFDNTPGARKILFFSKYSGVLTASVSIPATAPNISYTSGNFAYANNILWLFNDNIKKWIGYNLTSGSVGINEIENNISIIYPNPTSTILNIEVKEQTQISIANVLGDIVLKQTIYGLSSVDVSNLTTGVYFIQDSKSGKAVKFIKE